MRIRKIVSQNRRDFTALYECEHCGETVEKYGYDDNHFHNNVIPEMKCGECGKAAGDDYRPLPPKYAAAVVI
mgnify:CR=1 FL=1